MRLGRMVHHTNGAPLPLWERRRPPSAAVLENAEAELRPRRILDALRVRGLSPHATLLIECADRAPSSDADFVRATFSHKGRREGNRAPASYPNKGFRWR